VEFNGHKGRKGVKVNAAVSQEGLPLSILISPGSEHDSQRFIGVMESIGIYIRRGRPRCRPIELNADAAYDNKTIRSYLMGRGIKCNIPLNNRNRIKPKRGRPIRFDALVYSKRGCVERFFGWLKTGFRRLATRYESLNSCFLGLLNLACILIYWRKIYVGI
jgi:transposase